MERIGIYGSSQRLNRTLIVDGYEFGFHRLNADGNSVWRCIRKRVLNCRAQVVSHGLRIVSSHDVEHNHEGNVADVLARRAVSAMKLRMEDSTATPTFVQSAESATLNSSVLMALPKRTTLKRTLRRYQQKVNASGDIESPLPPVPKDVMFQMPSRYADFVLYDSGEYALLYKTIIYIMNNHVVKDVVRVCVYICQYLCVYVCVGVKEAHNNHQNRCYMSIIVVH